MAPIMDDSEFEKLNGIDDGSGDVRGIKDTLKNLGKQALNAVKDEGKTAAGKIGLRAVKAGASEAQKIPAVKAAIAEQKKEYTTKIAKGAALVIGGMLLYKMVFRRSA